MAGRCAEARWAGGRQCAGGRRGRSAALTAALKRARFSLVIIRRQGSLGIVHTGFTYMHGLHHRGPRLMRSKLLVVKRTGSRLCPRPRSRRSPPAWLWNGRFMATRRSRHPPHGGHRIAGNHLSVGRGGPVLIDGAQPLLDRAGQPAQPARYELAHIGVADSSSAWSLLE